MNKQKVIRHCCKLIWKSFESDCIVRKNVWPGFWKREGGRNCFVSKRSFIWINRFEWNEVHRLLSVTHPIKIGEFVY